MKPDQDSDLTSLRFLAIALIGLPVVIVLVFLPRDCFVDVRIFNIYRWVYLACLAVSVAGSWYWLHRVNYIVTKKGTQRLRPLLVPFYLLFMGVSIGFALLGVIVQSLSLVVLFTASTPAQFTTQLVATGRSKHCRMDYTLYNPPIGRDISICGDNKVLFKAGSGDRVTLHEMTGPYGARLQSISHLP
ncbi:MAG: hypothetical protein ACHQIO_09265 [Nevskiales bacterium]